MSSPVPPDARWLVDELLLTAIQRRASDIHVEPTQQGYEIRLRIDGLLETVAKHDAAVGRSLVTRLMVLGHLLTYRLDVPQEGRVTVPLGERPLDLRLAVMPTARGLCAAIRMPAELLSPRTLDDLGLPAGVLTALRRFAKSDGGMLLLTGPAGSGKTTTIYALLSHIAQTQPGLAIVALEDPVERDLPGVTQIEVSRFGQLTYETAFRSILRQDPQVLMLGEIRDAGTASLAVQAALSGHRLVSTLHAGDPAGAIARLLEMGLEPYQVASALMGVVSQRLLRRRSTEGGRVVVGEVAMLDEPVRKAVLARGDVSAIRLAIDSQGAQRIKQAAEELVLTGIVDRTEVSRVLGEDAQNATVSEREAP